MRNIIPSCKYIPASSMQGRVIPILTFFIAIVSLLGVVYIWLINGAPRTIPSVDMLQAAVSGAKVQQDNVDYSKYDTGLMAIAQLKNQVQQLASKQSQQQKNIEAVSGAEKNDWQLAQAEYLLRLAAQRLIIAKDPKGALMALMATQQTLEEQQNSALLPIREALAKDIANLKAIEKVDVEGIYANLAALSEQVMNLPQFEIPKTAKKEDKQTAEFSNEEMVEQLNTGRVETAQSFAQTVAQASTRSLQNIWSFLDIKYYSDFNVQPLLTSEQHAMYLQQLQLLLEQAKVAALKSQNTIYQQSLAGASQLLTNYGQKSTRAKEINAAINKLQAENVAVNYPEIAGALKKLVEYQGRSYKALTIKAKRLENVQQPASDSDDAVKENMPANQDEGV